MKHKSLKILIIGNGGREHAMVWKAAQSPLAQQIFVAPGNAGTAKEPKTQNVNINPTDVPALLAFAQENDIDLTIVGPEAPLVVGVVDTFRKAGLRCLGPVQQAARLEGSKCFAKDFMRRHRIPTATYGRFKDMPSALAYIHKHATPLVIKADGLAAGKGVVIAHSELEAIHAAENMLGTRHLGEQGEIVIESFLKGEEFSFIVLCDGKNIIPLAPSQDHKTRDDHDKGPNTGGMGAYSPARRIDSHMTARIIEEVITPTLDGLRSEGIEYTGFLYAGVMITHDNAIHVLEFNCRMGDPETQPIFMRMTSDFVELCLAAVDEHLDETKVTWDDRAALGVVMASKDYPGMYPTGEKIEGLENATPDNVKVFHAGTTTNNHHVVTNGGRVLCVTALGDDLAHAKKSAYDVVNTIHWPSAFYRGDIGDKGM